MNIQDYDYYALGVSGGKDSTALLLWYKYMSGLPMSKLRLTTADTGNEDLLTYAYIDMLRDEIAPIERLQPMCGRVGERVPCDFSSLAVWKKRFPSRRARFCTQWLKVIPSREYVAGLMHEGSSVHTVQVGDFDITTTGPMKHVLVLSGVRWEEGRASNTRGERASFEFDDGWMTDVYRPVIDWDIDDVWAIASEYLSLERVAQIIQDDPLLSEQHKRDLIARQAAHGIPRNPLYDMGARRVGCFPCVNSVKREVRAMAKYRPQRIDEIERMECDVSAVSSVEYSSFFHRNTVPIAHRSKNITTKEGEKMRVATIIDIVLWSKTRAFNPNQFDFDPDFMEPPSVSACDIGGMCE